MDRIEFTKNLGSENFGDNIPIIFNQIMALYDLVGSIDDTDLCAEKDPTGLSFSLLTDSKLGRDRIYSTLKDRKIEVYDHKYQAKVSKGKNNSILIKLEEEAME